MTVPIETARLTANTPGIGWLVRPRSYASRVMVVTSWASKTRPCWAAYSSKVGSSAPDNPTSCTRTMSTSGFHRNKPRTMALLKFSSASRLACVSGCGSWRSRDLTTRGHGGVKSLVQATRASSAAGPGRTHVRWSPTPGDQQDPPSFLTGSGSAADQRNSKEAEDVKQFAQELTSAVIATPGMSCALQRVGSMPWLGETRPTPLPLPGCC